MNYLSSKPPSARVLFRLLLVISLLHALPAMAQDTSAQLPAGESVMTGAVVSSSRNTLVVRDDKGQYQLFVFDPETAKPPALPVGSRVRVVSSPGEEPSVRVARLITPLDESTKPEEPAGAQAQPVPTEIRKLERDIERQLRRYQAGFRAGVALDPELVLLGAHAQMGPFFGGDAYFRPNVEFAFGEVTTLFAINLEGIYRLPLTLRQGRWSAYVGIGPAFTFLHQNFERQTGDERDIDFGDFESDIGLNILGGMRARRGMFLEIKGSIYARPAPTLRLILGYNF